MKNKKITFSLLNWFGETQAEIVKLQHAIKAIVGSSAIATYTSTDMNKATLVFVAGALVCELVSCLRIEDNEA
jgi:hypothetical protein